MTVVVRPVHTNRSIPGLFFSVHPEPGPFIPFILNIVEG